MKANVVKAAAAAIIVVMNVILSSANAQVVFTGKKTLYSKPTTEQRRDLEKSEDVHLDVIHGSSNWYAAADYAFGIHGSEHYIGAEVGRRFTDHFRLGVQGMWCVPLDITQHHSWVAVKPSLDIASSESSFYKKTGLDVSISGLVGAMAQTQGKKKNVNGAEKAHRDIPSRAYFTAGLAASINWNCAPHVQLRAEVSYLYAFEEKKLKDNLDEFVEGMPAEREAWVRSGNWISGQILVGLSIAYHF